MADDLKFGATFDLNLGEQEGVRLGEAMARGIQRGLGPVLGGALLGNGMPTTQGPASNERSVAGILEKILQSLDLGFGRMVEAGGGGGGGGGVGAKPGATPAPSPYGPTPSAGSGQAGGAGPSWSAIGGALGRLPVESGVNMFQKDFRDTSVVKFAADTLSGVPLLGPAVKMLAGVYENKDRVLGERMEMFRMGGERGRHDYARYVSGTEGEGDMKKYGLDRGEMFQLFKTATSYGAEGQDRARGLMALQGRYGLGQQGGSLMTSLVHSGNQASGEHKLFAEVLAVALGTQLDRGRWGEAFSAMTKAANNVQTGVADKSQLLQTQMFVGNMGAQFKGDTAQGNRATGMIQDMQGGGGGPLGNIMALRAAGLGQPGVTYQDAWMRVQRGSAAGGVRLADMIKQYTNLPSVKAYLASPGDGDPRLLTNAVFVLSMMMPNYKATDIEGMLKSMRKGVYGPTAHATAAMQDQLNLKNAPLPEKERSMIEHEMVVPSLQGTSPNFIGADRRTPGAIDDSSDLEGRSRGVGMSGDMPGVPQSPGDSGAPRSRGMEGYDERRSVWPSRPGDTDIPGKPGYRAAKPGEDLRHKARDIIISGGQPGASVYAPMDGIWLTATPMKANPKDPKQGDIADMLGDNNVRYRFVHLYFVSGLTKGARIRARQLIGTVAGGGTGWTPHLHLEAFKKGRGGKGEHVDPNTTMSEQQRSVMEGSRLGTFEDPGPDPGAPVNGDRVTPGGKPVKPEDVVPLSMNNGVDVHIYVHDGRVSVSKVASKRKQTGTPGAVGSKSKFGT